MPVFRLVFFLFFLTLQGGDTVPIVFYEEKVQSTAMLGGLMIPSGFNLVMI